MKTILCYGDSLTWGYDPATGQRIEIDKRWPCVLRNDLGNNYFIIEEGLNGRTTVWDDPLLGGCKNGMKYLIPCLASHRPVDIVILFLGTNDLKTRFSLSAAEIARGIRVLVDLIINSKAGPNENPPQILLIAPPLITELSNFAEEFESGKAKSLLLGRYYRQVAEEYNIAFLDSSKIVTANDLDGIHLDMDEHVKLGHVIADEIKKIME
jgi:lysophospholipase L1-like esterase